MTLKFLFVDMNAYFASVEQQLQPHLRGKPVGVIPMHADTTCCIAASYEAKKFGVKTGTKVRDAKAMCPQIELVQARVEAYVDFHHRIVEAVDAVIPVEQVFSIDEMSCKLMGTEKTPENTHQIGLKIKQSIASRVGLYVKCSVGAGPNRLIAKIATDLKKPDGLTIIQKHELPTKLLGLEVDDFPGIGTQMKKRLESYGVFTVEQLYAQPKHRFKDIWGGVVGERYWHLIRGEIIDEQPTHRRTVGQSHVLAPEYRTPEKAKGVMLRLIDKAAQRLRRLDYFANRLELSVSFIGGYHWRRVCKLSSKQDTQTMFLAATQAWNQKPPYGTPLKVSITLFDLTSISCHTQELFEEERSRNKLAHTIDQINLRFGSGCLYLAAMGESRKSAPQRIAFQQIPERIDLVSSHQSTG